MSTITIVEPITTTTFPGITFTDSGKERLTEVLAFLQGLHDAKHEQAQEIEDAFREKLAYLNGYGGEPTIAKCLDCSGDGLDTDGEICERCAGAGTVPLNAATKCREIWNPEKRFKVELSWDFAVNSFSVVWLKPKDGEWVYGWNGGFIWHGGSNDPMTITLTPQWFGIHT
jgi:hypothetical protein